MKYSALALAFIILTFKCFSKTTDGYYITLENDTIAGTIILGGYNIHRTVKISDDKGIWQMFEPKEIKEFGFTKSSDKFVFRTIFDGDSLYLFVKLEVRGSKTDLYHYEIQGINSQRNENVFLLVKPDKTYLVIRGYLSHEVMRGKLSFFYRDIPEAKTFIKSLFLTSRNELSEIKDLINFINGQVTHLQPQ